MLSTFSTTPKSHPHPSKKKQQQKNNRIFNKEQYFVDPKTTNLARAPGKNRFLSKDLCKIFNATFYLQ